MIIDCKSGHFQIDDHLKTANEYSKFKLRDVENECKKIMHDKKLSINKFDIAFQYYKKMIEEAEKNYPSEFSEMKEKTHIFCCKPGEKYTIYTNRDLTDITTTTALRDGIKIPEKPDFKYNLTRKGDENLIAHAIMNYGLKNISTTPDPIEFNINDVNLFGHYDIPVMRIKKVCNILEKLKIIKKCSEIQMHNKYVIARYQTTKRDLTKIGIPLINELFRDKNLTDIVANDLQPLETYDKNIDVT